MHIVFILEDVLNHLQLLAYPLDHRTFMRTIWRFHSNMWFRRSIYTTLSFNSTSCRSLKRRHRRARTTARRICSSRSGATSLCTQTRLFTCDSSNLHLQASSTKYDTCSHTITANQTFQPDSEFLISANVLVYRKINQFDIQCYNFKLDVLKNLCWFEQELETMLHKLNKGPERVKSPEMLSIVLITSDANTNFDRRKKTRLIGYYLGGWPPDGQIPVRNDKQELFLKRRITRNMRSMNTMRNSMRRTTEGMRRIRKTMKRMRRTMRNTMRRMRRNTYFDFFWEID